MNAISITIMSLLALVIAAAPRRLAMTALMYGALFLTVNQTLAIGGANVFPLRLLGLVAFGRVALRGELRLLKVTTLDRLIFLTYTYVILVFVVRTLLQGGTDADVTQISIFDRIGSFADITLSYVALRAFINDRDDLVWLLRSLIPGLVVFACIVVVERVTGDNPFAAIGGMQRIQFDADRVRAVGSFKHPSLLGTVGAGLLPLYIALWRGGITWWECLIGVAACLAIVVLANAGGPLNMVGVVLVGWLLWPFRQNMKIVRGTIAFFVTVLCLGMWGPPWWLLDKVSALTGGDGWHRTELIDQAVSHLDSWWLFGMSLANTRFWFAYLVKGAADITNTFLQFGLDAGLAALVLLIAVFVRSFGRLGVALKAERKRNDGNLGESLLWGLGVALTAHAANFLAITYFDQTYLFWVLLLAAISSLTASANVVAVESRKRPFPSRSLATRRSRGRKNARIRESPRRI